MLIDAHAHIYDYTEEELAKALGRAKANGVELVVGLGADDKTSRRTIELAKGKPMVYAGVGVHPWYMKWPFTEEDVRTLRALAKEEKVRFIGEIGLDMNRNAERFREQQEIFVAQLALAKELDLPINVHCRNAHRELLGILKAEGMPPRGGMHHGYGGGTEFLSAYLDLGFYISIGRSGRNMDAITQEVVKAIPLERLLLETDSSLNSYKNENGYEPATVSVIAENVAQVRGISAQELGEVTTANLKRLIGLR